MRKFTKYAAVLIFLAISFSVAMEYLFHFIHITPLEDPKPHVPEGNIFNNIFYRNDKSRAEYEMYFNGTYSLRDLLVKTWNTFSIYLFSSHEKVFTGEEGWYFLSNYIQDHLERDRDIRKNSDKILKMLDKLDSELDVNNIDCFMLIPPYKTRIYPEYFQGLPPDLTQESFLNKLLLSYVPKKGRIHFIDIYKVLLENKSITQLYFKGDTHWTELAGFIANDIFMEQLNALADVKFSKLGYTASPGLEKAKYGAEYTFMQGLQPLVEYTRKYYRVGGVPKIGLDDFKHWYYANSAGNSSSLPSLVVIGDSYFHAFMDKHSMVEYFKATSYYNNDNVYMTGRDIAVPSDTRFILLEMFEQNTTKLLTDAWWVDIFRVIQSVSPGTCLKH